MDLIMGENHVQLQVFKSSNSFGEQVLEFIHEDLEGRITIKKLIRDEGNWLSWDKETLIGEWLKLILK